VTDLPARRILFVHAHPDDETIGTGATMARYAAAGDHVTLVTCTLGEEGEIHLPELALFAAGEADQLGGYRYGELHRAAAAMGVRDVRFLGGAGRYRDSGMMGTSANDHPRAFWRADLDEAAAKLVDVIREIRPQVVVTYDANGGYGHPDHIQSHRVAMRAVELANDEAIGPDKTYWTAVPLSVLRAGMQAFSESGNNPFEGVEKPEDLPMAVPDERIAARIEAHEQVAAKMGAVRAHASQIPESSWLFTMATNFGEEFMGVEYFELVAGVRGPSGGVNGWENDLFAGLPVAAAMGGAGGPGSE
jgi:N-acetyl-1-D-myo-inositol-2-amino-2-deoxy-alpha-D-glucopyranoside deacetylase